MLFSAHNTVQLDFPVYIPTTHTKYKCGLSYLTTLSTALHRRNSTWARNGRRILHWHFIRDRVLTYSKSTTWFTACFLPEEAVLRMLSSFKIHCFRQRLNPRTSNSIASRITAGPPKTTIRFPRFVLTLIWTKGFLIGLF